jgi:CHAD domain-containing protein
VKRYRPERLTRIVQRRAALFLARGMRALGGEHLDELHAMRIAGKRLRYNLEFFAGQLAPENATALGLMTLMQDRLGAIADAEALERSLREIAATLEASDARGAGIERCIANVRLDRERAIERMRALWRGQGHSPYPEMLAASVAVALESSSSNAE